MGVRELHELWLIPLFQVLLAPIGISGQTPGSTPSSVGDPRVIGDGDGNSILCGGGVSRGILYRGRDGRAIFCCSDGHGSKKGNLLVERLFGIDVVHVVTF